MSEQERYGDGLCDDGAPEIIPPRASRTGRRSGVILPGQDNDTIVLEAVRAAPRRSSIIKVRYMSYLKGWLRLHVMITLAKSI